MAAAAALLLGALPALAGADPVQWPTGPGTDPLLEASAHTLRFAGPDRYQTNLAAALALRGGGDFPFSSPDRTGGDGPRLADADHWWGTATCPFSVLVTAGDTFADALAAASLSDPTNRSDEPRVQRVGSADPLFDPVGGFDRVDTDAAPIIVTGSARQGADGLDPAARLAVTDLASGGCTTAREAILVGGEAAVPPEVVSELLSIGYDEVFRVAGRDRYATAAAVAQAMGTEAPAPGQTCLDPDANDGDVRMGYYGNAVPEFRFAADDCRLLSRSVVLADGSTGADALAAGWWTSFWQVPVLLVAPDGSLPAATRSALQTLEVDHVIVLGGTARIPEATVEEAGRLASALVGRIAGPDRYATSVEMARRFGGWYPSPDGTAGTASLVCLAGSAGSGGNAVGWADALAAGPWCARASGAAANPTAPRRALPPIDGPHATGHVVGGLRPAHDAVPILLTAPGATALPPPVAGLLGEVFDPSAPWCTSRVDPGSCQAPGFGVVFGGTGVVSDAASQQLALLVSGSRYTKRGDLAPALDSGFPTKLHLAPVFSVLDGAGDAAACFGRTALRDVRWLIVAADESQLDPVASVDIAATGGYSPEGSTPLCQPLAGDGQLRTVGGVSLSGRRTAVQEFPLGGDWLSLSRPIVQEVTATDAGWTSDGPPLAAVTYRRDGQTTAVERATLDLRFRSTDGSGAAPFTASGAIETSRGPVELLVQGEGVLDGELWKLAGRTSLQAAPFGQADATGGFAATLELGGSGQPDQLAWAVDGLIPPE